MTGGRSWRRNPIKQQKRTVPNKQGEVGRQQQQQDKSDNELCKEEQEIIITRPEVRTKYGRFAKPTDRYQPSIILSKAH